MPEKPAPTTTIFTALPCPHGISLVGILPNILRSVARFASERGFPRSLIEFQSRFATESACAQYLFERRWPEGFVCPGCGGGRAWLLNTKAFTYEFADCGRQIWTDRRLVHKPSAQNPLSAQSRHNKIKIAILQELIYS